MWHTLNEWNSFSGVSPQAAMMAVSMVGDLSMGQPLDHSRRVAGLAWLLAQATGGEGEHADTAAQVALLRWSGCTANAEGVMHLLGDDVGGRRDMLSQTLGEAEMRALRHAKPLAEVHCEVSSEVAHVLGLGGAVKEGLRHVFERYDGQGTPIGLAHPFIPEVVYQVVLAGDLEILSRVHGLDAALAWIAEQADKRYPAALARLLIAHAPDWLAQLQRPGVLRPPLPLQGELVSLALVSDVVDLKLPWLVGYSRQTAQLTQQAGKLWGLTGDACALMGQAALIHGMGRAAVPNRIWNSPGPLLAGDLERVRLVPYWTLQAASQTEELAVPGQMAAHAYERLDGSGYFRALGADSLKAEHRLLAAALAWTALLADRPWRPALNESEAERLLMQEAERGCFDAQACQAVIAAARYEAAPVSRVYNSLLSKRESQILQLISQGASNKAVARMLGISPSTVGTHMESIFRKLQCTTRAAATLKALTLGLI